MDFLCRLYENIGLRCFGDAFADGDQSLFILHCDDWYIYQKTSYDEVIIDNLLK
jgi:hypothetical protein